MVLVDDVVFFCCFNLDIKLFHGPNSCFMVDSCNALCWKLKSYVSLGFEKNETMNLEFLSLRMSISSLFHELV